MKELSGFEAVASYLEHPLVLAGFALFLFFVALRYIVSKLPIVTKKIADITVLRLVSFGFILALLVIVLGFVRRALSLQEVPPTQVLIGLALILTFMVMAPTFDRIKDEALVPYMEHRMSDGEALEITVFHMRNFMWSHVDFRDLEVMMAISNPNLINAPLEKIPLTEVPTTTLIPAFMLSEMKRAFEMGFMIYLPFLVIDLVVASTLISMGMLVLPPVLISLPFKVLIFVLVDGWGKVVEQLAISFS